jgi:hypothetical protein
MSFLQANPLRPDNLVSAPKNVTKTTTVQAKPITLTLSSISITGELRYAQINNQLLAINDLISGYRVVKIESNSVLLIKGSAEKLLYLNAPGSFKIVPSTEDSPSE